VTFDISLTRSPKAACAGLMGGCTTPRAVRNICTTVPCAHDYVFAGAIVQEMAGHAGGEDVPLPNQLPTPALAEWEGTDETGVLVEAEPFQADGYVLTHNAADVAPVLADTHGGVVVDANAPAGAPAPPVAAQPASEVLVSPAGVSYPPVDPEDSRLAAAAAAPTPDVCNGSSHAASHAPEQQQQQEGVGECLQAHVAESLAELQAAPAEADPADVVPSAQLQGLQLPQVTQVATSRPSSPGPAAPLPAPARAATEQEQEQQCHAKPQASAPAATVVPAHPRSKGCHSSPAVQLPCALAPMKRLLGVDPYRHHNLHLIDDDVAVTCIANTVVFVTLSTGEQRLLPGIDGGGVGAVAVHPGRQLLAVAEKSRNTAPCVYLYDYPSLEVKKVRAGLRRHAVIALRLDQNPGSGSESSAAAGAASSHHANRLRTQEPAARTVGGGLGWRACTDCLAPWLPWFAGPAGRHRARL
jgi:hypothetical protein